MQPEPTEQPAPSLAFTLRDGLASDRPYITHAWVAANADTPTARALGAEYKHAHRRLIWAWLPACSVRIACDVQDEDAILGFFVASGDGLHYVHVRRDFRGLGIARALVGELVDESVVYTHQPSDPAHYRRANMMSPHPAKWMYNPYPFLAGPKS